MRYARLLLAVLLAATAAPAGAACTYPDEITIPDGATATKDEMVAGQKAVKDYMAAVEAYLACLDEEDKKLGEAATEEQKSLHVKRHNSAVDAMNEIAARFNEQVRAFKAQGG
jgi:hypothetical protein